MTLSYLSSKTHWHVLGAGATGCLWAAHLARSGTPCVMLAKGWSGTATVVVIHKQKAVFKETLPVLNSQEEQECLREKFINRLLVLTKAPQAAQAIRSMSKYLAPDAAVVLLGNGLLGVKDALLRTSHTRHIDRQDDVPFSSDATTHLCPLTFTLKLFLGSSTHGSHIVGNNTEESCDAAGPHALSNEVWTANTPKQQQSPINRTFTIEHSGRGSVWIGADADGEGNDSLTHLIATELSASGIPVAAVETLEVVPRLWQKLSVNAAINASTALARCKNSVIGSTAAGSELLDDICNECAPIAIKACGLQDGGGNVVTPQNYRIITQGNSLVLNHPLVGYKELKRQLIQLRSAGYSSAKEKH